MKQGMPLVPFRPTGMALLMAKQNVKKIREAGYDESLTLGKTVL
jgi:hypothetical protein